MKKEQEVVVFRIEEEEYAIKSEKVKEFFRYKRSGKLVNTPKWVEAVVNSNNRLIPGVSLSAKFGLKEHRPKDRMVIVTELGLQQIGVIIDEIIAAPKMAFAEIKPISSCCGKTGSCIQGIGKLGNRIIFLLDIAHLFTDDEQNALKAVDLTRKVSVLENAGYNQVIN